jgi:hypothetical protein
MRRSSPRPAPGLPPFKLSLTRPEGLHAVAFMAAQLLESGGLNYPCWCDIRPYLPIDDGRIIQAVRGRTRKLTRIFHAPHETLYTSPDDDPSHLTLLDETHDETHEIAAGNTPHSAHSEEERALWVYGCGRRQGGSARSRGWRGMRPPASRASSRPAHHPRKDRYARCLSLTP